MSSAIPTAAERKTFGNILNGCATSFLPKDRNEKFRRAPGIETLTTGLRPQARTLSHVSNVLRSPSDSVFAFAHLRCFHQQTPEPPDFSLRTLLAHLPDSPLSIHHSLASPLAPPLQITSRFPVAAGDPLSTSSSFRLQNHWFFCLRTLPPISLKARRNVPYER